MSASLASFFPDSPFQPPFGGGTLPEESLPSEHRRARPLLFTDQELPVLEKAERAAPSPLRQLLLDPALAPLLFLHPYQAEPGREGEREWLFGCRELLRERLAYGSLGSPAGSRGGALEQAGDLLRAWTRERQRAESDGIVFVATEAEIAAGSAPAKATCLGPCLAFAPARLYLLTPGAVEEEIALGGDALPALVEAIHHVGSLAGMAFVDPRLLGAGIHPARLGFDLALFDFSFLMEGEGGWCLPAFDRRLTQFLPPDADEEWTNRPALLLRVEAGLRLMGEAGLAAAATAAAIRADYCGRLLEGKGMKGSKTLLELLVPGRGAVGFSGLESAEEIEALAREIADGQA